ncbi:uncharacterized protein WM294_015667 [Sarcoramphus papa]
MGLGGHRGSPEGALGDTGGACGGPGGFPRCLGPLGGGCGLGAPGRLGPLGRVRVRGVGVGPRRLGPGGVGGCAGGKVEDGAAPGCLGPPRHGPKVVGGRREGPLHVVLQPRGDPGIRAGGTPACGPPGVAGDPRPGPGALRGRDVAEAAGTGDAGVPGGCHGVAAGNGAAGGGGRPGGGRGGGGGSSSKMGAACGAPAGPPPAAAGGSAGAGGCGAGGALGADLELGLRLLRVPAEWARLGPPGLDGWAPLGVVAILMSGPCSLAALLWKLGPLLAMGNAALVLPPAEAPLAPLLVAELSREAGVLPPGLLSVVTGTPCLRRALRAHPHIAAVTFLGAHQEEVQDMAWGSPCRGPRLGWAWGGRVVVIVLDSADLDSAAAAIAGSTGTPPALFPWGGCVVLAQEGVVAPLERRLRARLGGLRVGDPLDAGTDVGPLPTPATPPEGLVQAACEEGAEGEMGGWGEMGTWGAGGTQWDIGEHGRMRGDKGGTGSGEGAREAMGPHRGARGWGGAVGGHENRGAMETLGGTQVASGVFQPPVMLPPGGRFYPPTLITGVAPTSRCLRELAPGPVLVLLPVRSPGEAVTVASRLPHVAAAAVWAQDVTLALDTADRLPLGLVWLNALNLLDPMGGCAGGPGTAPAWRRCESSGVPPGSPPWGQGTLRHSWSRTPAQSRSQGGPRWPPTPLMLPQPWRPPAASPWGGGGCRGRRVPGCCGGRRRRWGGTGPRGPPRGTATTATMTTVTGGCGGRCCGGRRTWS